MGSSNGDPRQSHHTQEQITQNGAEHLKKKAPKVSKEEREGVNMDFSAGSH